MTKHTYLLLLALFLLPKPGTSQEGTYQPTKESILQHPTPEWFEKARLGVFIHFIPSGKEAVLPEQFSAEEWINLFDKAGAEYFVFTTKHNNGWCNWPSQLTENSAREVNGPRDLVTPLVASARKTGMKVGLYYNMMDRYEGVTKDMAKDPDREPSEEYVLGYMHPQIKELVSTYQPDLLWTDGDWISTSDYWHSNEIVAWLYNWAEQTKLEISLTDRWGKDIRITEVGTTPEKYGDYWTLECRIMTEVVTTHPWESSLTPFNGWDYKKNEKFRIPVAQIIETLSDIASKGGKMLLNIGPKPDGSIRAEEQEMLLGLGQWLEVNGEAIFGTIPLKQPELGPSTNANDRARELYRPQEWFIGHQKIWEMFAKINQAQGPVRFTRKGAFVYAIHQGWPGKTVELPALPLQSGSTIHMLGVEEPLSWKVIGEKLVIELPSKKPCEHAFTLKMDIK